MKAKFRQANGKSGIKRSTTEIIASTMKMLGARNSKEVNSSSETSETSEDSETSDPETEEDEVPF